MHKVHDANVSDLNRRSLLVMYSIFYVIVVMFFSYISQSNIAPVFVGTIPFLVYIVVFFLFLADKEMSYWGLWVFPVILAVPYYLVWKSGSVGFISDMEGPSVTVLNILLSYITNVFFLFSSVYYKTRGERLSFERQEKRLKEHFEQERQRFVGEIDTLKHTIKEYENKLKITKENFTANLRGVEDKCKAINFVIGRVYSGHKGGSNEIRGSIRIDKELYNSFSEITKEFKEEDSGKLLKLLEKLYGRLVQLESAEKDVIDLKGRVLNLVRNGDGKDKVIDVLAKNDKDPVKDYYSEAKEVCEKLIGYLKGG